MIKAPKYPNFLAIILIVFLGSAVYVNSLGNGFVYDDELVIVENPFLNKLENVKYFFGSDYFAGSQEFTYRPVLTLSYLLDYHFWKFNPLGYHLTNVVIHILNAILLYFLFLLFLGFFGTQKLRYPIALLASILFVLHPIQTEVVNGVAFREDALFSLFFFLTLIFFLKTKTTRNPLFYVCSLASYFLALLSKETALIMLFFILLIDFYDIEKFYFISLFGYLAVLIFGPKAVIVFFIAFVYAYFKSKEKMKKMIIYSGFAAVTAFYGYIIFFAIVNPNPALKHQLTGQIPAFGVLILEVCNRLAIYLKLLFFPFRLSAEYAFTKIYSLFEPTAFFSLATVAAVFAFLARCISKKRLLVFSGFWVLVPLGLVIMARFQPIAEHQLYFSCAGFSLFLAIALIKGVTTSSRSIKIVTLCLIVAILSFYSLRTITRNSVWKDALTFWEERIKYPPATERAHSSLGDAYFRKGLYDKAKLQYKKALEIDPRYVYARTNLGTVYFIKKEYEEAEKEYKKVLKLDSVNIKALNKLGMIYTEQGLLDKAEEQFKRIIEVNPFYLEAYINLGNVYSKMKRLDEAEAQLRKAIEVEPSFVIAYYNLGNVYLNKAKYAMAIREYKKALGLNPNLLDAYNNLGAVYFKMGLHKKAKTVWQRALEIDPTFLSAKQNLQALELLQKK